MRYRVGTWVAALACALSAGCELDNAPPPLAEVEVKSEDTSTALTTTTITDPSALAGVDRVRGHLIIQTTGPVSLPDVVVIEGDLRIVGTEARPRSANVYLPKLARVGGNIEVGYSAGTARLVATKLTDLGGHLDVFAGDWAIVLPLLERINGDLRLRDGELVEVDFANLRTIEGSLRLSDMKAARGVTLALDGLQTVGGNISIRNSNVGIEASRLLTVGGDFSVETGEVNLGLEGLREVLGDLRFEGVTSTRLSLSTLRTVGDDLVFDHLVGDFAELAFNDLTAVGGDLRIVAVSNLASLTLAQLTATGGSLVLEGSPSLTQLNGTQLAEIGGDLIIKDGTSVTAALGNVVSVAGDLIIANHDAFLGVFPALSSVGGDLRIVSTGMNFTGMEAIANVEGDLELSDITGSDDYDELRFERLRALGGSFVCRGTRDIEKLTAPSLLSIGSVSAGDLMVRDNADLTGITFSELGAVTGGVIVRNNPLLASDDIESQLGEVASSATPIVCGNLGDETCP